MQAVDARGERKSRRSARCRSWLTRNPRGGGEPPLSRSLRPHHGLDAAPDDRARSRGLRAAIRATRSVGRVRPARCGRRGGCAVRRMPGQRMVAPPASRAKVARDVRVVHAAAFAFERFLLPFRFYTFRSSLLVRRCPGFRGGALGGDHPAATGRLPSGLRTLTCARTADAGTHAIAMRKLLNRETKRRFAHYVTDDDGLPAPDTASSTPRRRQDVEGESSVGAAGRRRLGVRFGLPRFTLRCARRIASASISTSIAGSISALTSTIAVAGRIAPNTSPCARPTFSQSARCSSRRCACGRRRRRARPPCASAASMFAQRLLRLGVGVARTDDRAVAPRSPSCRTP